MFLKISKLIFAYFFSQQPKAFHSQQKQKQTNKQTIGSQGEGKQENGCFYLNGSKF